LHKILNAFLKESLCICYLSMVYFVCVCETRNSQWSSVVFTCRRKLFKKTMFENDIGFKKYKNINRSIKQRALFSLSAILLPYIGL